MISYILLILIFIMVIGGYLVLFLRFLSIRKPVGDESGMDVSFSILDDDSEINLVEGGNDYFSSYNIKRKMIRLSSNTYSGVSLLSRSIASFLVGCAIVRNKYFDLLAKCGIKKIRFISFSAVIVLIISSMFSFGFDAKIGIFILSLVGVYQYIFSMIYVEIIEKVKLPLEISLELKFNYYINKLFFITTLISILRMVVIVLEI